MFMDQNGRVLGKWNAIDFSFTLFLILVAVGVIAVQSGWHKTSGQTVEGTTTIEYTFLVRNAKSMTPDLFKVGDTLSMTIRNQPRGEVAIVKSETSRKKALIQNNTHGGGNGYFVVDDPTEPNGYDFLVTVTDKAEVTKEGYVTEGVKVKVGLPIDVEGQHYRFPAVIVAVKDVAAKDTDTAQ